MKTLLILGGSGFIGKSILDSFCSGALDRYKIKKLILISRNISKLKKKNIKNKNLEFKSLDLSKKIELPEADIIIHAAANSIKKISLARFKKSIKLSSKITDNLVEFLKISKK